jgi:regulatory protein
MPDTTSSNAALSKAMTLCSRMEYCQTDIRKKLEAWGVPSQDENKIIQVLIKENFLNEDRYARAFVRDKFRYNRWGRLKIASHLNAKNINGDTIRSALAEIDADEYVNVIKNLITSHRKTIKAKNQYDLKGKLLRFGSSRGFESSILYDILNDLAS